MEPIDVIAPESLLEDTASAEVSDLAADLDEADRDRVDPVFALSELLPDFASDTDSSFAVVRVRTRRLLGSALVMGISSRFFKHPLRLPLPADRASAQPIPKPLNKLSTRERLSTPVLPCQFQLFPL